MYPIHFLLLYLLNATALLSHAQLIRLALKQTLPSDVFVSSPLLFGECEVGKCSNESSPQLGGTDSQMALDQLKPCEFKENDYSEILGRIELEANTYCDPRTLRAIPRRTCCFPQLPGRNFPRMALYPVNASAFTKNAIPLDWRSVEDSRKIPAAERIVILVHGWRETPLRDGSLWIYPTIEAWTKLRQTPVIVVDYTNTSNYHYFQNAANVRTMGQALGYAIVNWQIANRTHLVGFSLGGQMVGEIGKYTQRHGHLIKECIALDPAGPGFDSGSPRIHITPNDCELVQTVHSSSESVPDSLGIVTRQFGSYYHTGACDFWINCGRRQAADCMLPILGATMNNAPSNLYYYSVPSACSHHRAPLLYSASVAGKCNYTGYECTNCNDFRLTNGCRVNFQGEQMHLPPFNSCKPGDRKDFYLQTQGNTYPYC